MEKKKQLTRFVKDVLGCRCPDEVFEHIEWRHMAALEHVDARSVILGRRLLLFLWKANDVSLVRSNLPVILSLGREERDRVGLNRFRAVIATDDVHSMGSAVHKLFEGFSDKDENVHLHVVHTDDVAGLCSQSMR